MKLKPWAGLALCAGLLAPREAWVSGSYGDRLIEDRYLYSYQESVSKIFADPEHARGYYAHKERLLRRGFLAARPTFDAFLSWADSRNVRCLPYDPFLPSFPIADARQWKSIDEDAYPVNLVFDALQIPEAAQRLEVTVERKPPEDAMAEFIKRAAALTLAQPPTEEEPADNALEAFESPIGVRHIGRYAGLWVGTTARARPENARRLRDLFQRRADALSPLLASRLPDAAAVSKHAGVTNARPLVEKLGREIPEVRFNPYGPLLDHCWRARLERGHAIAIVLFAPETALRDDQPTFEFLRWIAEGFDTAHERSLQREKTYFRVRHGERSDPQYALWELRDDTSERGVRLLKEVLDRRGPVDELSRTAAELLSQRDSPIREEVFLQIARRQEPAELLPRAAEALAHCPKPAVVEALTAVWNNKSLSWSQRYPARDAVRSLMEKWPDPEYKKTALAALAD